ncbi:hypothetical protein NC651_019274 [Populus alba x Populus x berolinensis]|nr:hypothetical protein NC651_019274 [Populus alba x Populus x berolinensis]
MARSLSVSLTKTYCLTSSTRFSSRLLTLRAQSNIPNRNSPSETDDSSSASSSTDPLLRKLEDAIHRIIVRRAAPDWLPFLPGSSYWVPSPRSTSGSLGIAHLVEKLANPLSDEESLSTTTVRGWPSSDYFVKGAPAHMMELKLTSKEVESDATSSNVSHSEDEEGIMSSASLDADLLMILARVVFSCLGLRVGDLQYPNLV